MSSPSVNVHGLELLHRGRSLLELPGWPPADASSHLVEAYPSASQRPSRARRGAGRANFTTTRHPALIARNAPRGASPPSSPRPIKDQGRARGLRVYQ